MKVTIKGNLLIIEAELNPNPEPSKSLKTLVVATSHGNQATTATVNGKVVTVGFTAYIKP